jgi:hypothetical protein
MLMLLFLAPSLGAYTGREIMDMTRDLVEPETASSRIVMVIHKGKRVLEKEFEIMTKKFGDDESKTLVSFIRPTKIKLLTHTRKEKEDDQWLRLSSGKIKRIAGSDKGKTFVNSHITYEDMGSRDLDDYEYTYLGDVDIHGFDCYQVEAVSKKKKKVYDRSVAHVRKTDSFVIRIDFYKKGKLHKSLENFDVKKVEGILTPFRVIVTLASGKGRTELTLTSVTYNEKMKNSTFNKEALR